MKNPWIFPVAALAVGAVGGFISGKNTGSGDTAAVAEDAASRASRSSTRGEASPGEATKRGSRVDNTGEAFRKTGNSTRLQALMDFYAGLTPEQLAEEAGKLENLPMGERMIASFLLFGRWAEVDPTAAMAYTETMGMAGAFVRPTVLQSWASVDPANAAKYFSENPREFAMMGMMGGRGPMGGGQGAGSIIATEWAKQDPAAALAWASSLEKGKGDAMTAVVSEVANTDPKKASEMLAKMDPADQAGAHDNLATKWGASNYAEAQAWISTLPAEQQDAARASAIEGLATKNALLASREIAKMAAGEDRDDAVPDVARNLARTDPKGAAAWVMSLDSEEAQGDAMGDIMPSWTVQNPAAALAFANGLPAGDVKDNALSSYIFSDTTTDPAKLITYADGIEDEGDHNRAVGMAAMRWMQEDSVAATEYIQQSQSIPNNMKERLIEGRGMWGGGRRGGGGN